MRKEVCELMEQASLVLMDGWGDCLDPSDENKKLVSSIQKEAKTNEIDKIKELFEDVDDAMLVRYEYWSCHRLAKKLQDYICANRPSWKNTVRLPKNLELNNQKLHPCDLVDMLDYKFFDSLGRIYNRFNHDTGWVSKDLDSELTPRITGIK